MAGDWIKVEMETPDKPEIHYMASALNLDPDAVVGKLFRVWSWFDKHTENGNAVGVTYSLVDRIASVTGFAECMAFVGWLKQDGHSLILPRFDRHNGKTAKNRALTNERVAKSRKVQRISNAECNAETVTKTVTREEKRREDVKDIAPTEKRPRKATQTAIPENFVVSDRVKVWAKAKGYTRLPERLEYFESYARRSGKTYADWDEALMASIREDWAKLGGPVQQALSAESIARAQGLM